MIKVTFIFHSFPWIANADGDYVTTNVFLKMELSN